VPDYPFCHPSIFRPDRHIGTISRPRFRPLPPRDRSSSSPTQAQERFE
jgi:hypothetical protein